MKLWEMEVQCVASQPGLGQGFAMLQHAGITNHAIS